MVDDGIGNTEPELAEWGGLEVMVVSVSGDFTEVERGGRTAVIPTIDLRRSVHKWAHGKKRYVDGTNL